MFAPVVEGVQCEGDGAKSAEPSGPGGALWLMVGAGRTQGMSRPPSAWIQMVHGIAMTIDKEWSGWHATDGFATQP